MPSRLFPYAFLILSIGFTSTFAIQDLRYYQDLLPNRSPEEIAALKLQQLERLLKSRNQNAPYGSPPFPHLEDFGLKEQRRREYERQSFDPFSENSLIHSLQKRRQKHISNYPPSQLGDGLEEAPNLREYNERNPREFLYPFFHSYSNDVGPFDDPKPQHRENPEYPTATEYRGSHHQVIKDRGMKEGPILDFGGKYVSRDRHKPIQQYPGELAEDRDEAGQQFEQFTYKFDEPNDRDEESRHFALRPNEFGYDKPDIPVLKSAAPETAIDLDEDERTDRTLADDEGEDIEMSSKDLATLPEPFQDHINDEEDDQELPAVERRADTHSPSVMAVDRKISNDIYFIAVVAGCSAAAMFILVLISLTWCRLQRGAKAAADVEYPAYGVTGPNKDTSPSGDRRLAQSAQMYHYQHQKQQIIAMESRTTATARDHGSVSEAESDEENEEGDYTVYECPGLAPTGEMEVKNPLFHDDPTPATPAAGQGQTNRSSEDHNM